MSFQKVKILLGISAVIIVCGVLVFCFNHNQTDKSAPIEQVQTQQIHVEKKTDEPLSTKNDPIKEPEEKKEEQTTISQDAEDLKSDISDQQTPQTAHGQQDGDSKSGKDTANTDNKADKQQGSKSDTAIVDKQQQVQVQQPVAQPTPPPAIVQSESYDTGEDWDAGWAAAGIIDADANGVDYATYDGGGLYAE